MLTPKVSVIIPVYNEEYRIEKCLASIRSQIYPQNEIELLIIDDKSTDSTIAKCKKFNCKIYTNGTHNIEIAKSIGVSKSTGTHCLFMDSDNTLIDEYWIQKAINILNIHKDVAAVQAESFYYSKSHSLVTQYCDLYGINDPLALYLGKRGQKMHINEKFPKQGNILFDNLEYSVVNFDKKTLPPIGSQGYLIRKSLIKKTNWKPYMFHIDTAYQLVAQGINTFSYLKSPVEHEYADSLNDMKTKLQRNLRLFIEQSSLRVYKYDLNKRKILLSGILMISIVHPLIFALSLFIRNPKKAWLLHPLVCLFEVYWYLEVYVKYYIASKLSNDLSKY